MEIIIHPRAGERLSDQIDLANELLKRTDMYIDRVVVHMNGGPKVMKTWMTPKEIRKYVWDGYDG